MIEIRIHGRGGQGAVTASEILAIASFKDGKFSQAFPSFGPERSGAPVEAYCRIDKKFINLRTHIYEPDILLVLDSSLIKSVDITKGLKKNGTIIINSETKPKLFYKLYNIDATSIAMDTIGKPIVNTAMLGAFAKATKLVSLKSIEEALKEKFSGTLLEKNLQAVRKAYNEVK